MTEGTSPSAEPSRPFRVLVVDDCDDLRDLIRLRLDATEGFAVVGEACDGAEGLALATLLQPDLVLLDLRMPRMDGLEALPAILRAAPATRVVVFSGENEGAAAEQALAGGAAQYVVKGTSLRQLVQVMSTVLEA
ncbi:DNA-binding NarL/FixJ family response regulator [Marmoricola sp. URHA0025 HA25]